MSVFFILFTGKKGGDDLFDKLDTSKLNAHLKGLMTGLTAKVFRTYNASITLDAEVRGKTGFAYFEFSFRSDTSN